VHTGHHSHSTPAQLLLLARRFPAIRFIMGHAGSTDYSTDVVPVVGLVDNIVVESSFGRPPAFVAKLEQMGADRGIMGSGHPYNDLVFEWSEMLRLVPEERRDSVCGGTITRLLENGS